MRTQRTQIAIESGQQIFQQSLQRRSLLSGNQSALVGPPKKMAGFVERTARDADESLVVDWRSASVSFRDVRSDTVRCTNDLMTDCGSSEGIPTGGDTPNQIRQLLGHGVDFEAFEGELRHGNFSN